MYKIATANFWKIRYTQFPKKKDNLLKRLESWFNIVQMLITTNKMIPFGSSNNYLLHFAVGWGAEHPVAEHSKHG